ncbi:DNA gyrase/topoisomerase IV subunit A [Prevotella lacticifex]|jgi:topoisomerase-4 subunit A|uniref:DNA topoisomerase IV subunit A n=1 Tax=Prevotella lacticifex TaxID=2854755 RepID=A0A9R1CYZ3_9BACT|nr:DNA topoisomerase IV subunit A [Prevotella lacticifex]GJG38644.1 DNA topoisomerase IV subunit A [Prevotella lacticifex]GJG42673.1 DNA topoisomerase IV subunit A [Prevotella lacticifex]GJG45001.1 DNA topoisomerase IV subunit A [Prevotella lacticifex]GJG49025.1 DNA topoisomerase IV subunit A [Prevotella lacticifex]
MDDIKDKDKDKKDENLSRQQDETGTDGDDLAVDEHSDYKPVDRFDASAVHHLSGMYKNWFLDYASYVILERAVPHIEDGLKPVQRRILHSMKQMDDGRYNKVANIVGHTMQYHPHGDASIGDALVQMGQKDLLIDTQGNWGNILTGDSAAAPRYIEARLSKFALDTVFNPKTTEWQLSYDGRNKEPITLPVKFPLLLAQGANGIAVGLSSRILPHNINEICEAAISYLRGEEFHLYPDFPTGGSIDVSRYNDGQRGGTLKVRAKIEKLDNKTLVIREIPFTKTASSLQESITKAVEKGKLKIRKVEDMTAREVEIQLHLAPGVSSDKTIDALYAFTDCEINIAPNCCVIEDNKPQFLTVSDVLRHSVDRTKGLLRRELEIRRGELQEQLFYASLEQIFIEERIYKGKPFENATNTDELCAYIDKCLTPFYPSMIREVRKEDILRLLEIKMQRIAKFNKDKNEELIARIKDEIAGIDKDLSEMTRVTIEWFQFLQKKYGKDHPRRTEIKSFDTIIAAKVAEKNEKLYVDRKEGFIGYGLKKAEFVQNCSDLDDVVVFFRDGKYKVIKIQDKVFVGKNILHVQVFKKGDKRTIYNVVYRDGKTGPYYIKRFNITSITRDREYDLTLGTPGSKVMYFTANPNGEAEVIKVTLNPNPKKKKQNIFMEKDFSTIKIKGRAAQGNLLTREGIHRISLKSHGHSTLGGRKVWFDPDVKRINFDSHGELLGEFFDDDEILVVLKNGEYYFTNFDSNNHYDGDILRIEKFDSKKVWTAVVYDADNQNYPYLKRFYMEESKKHQSFVGDNPNSRLILLTDQVYPRINVVYGGADAARGNEEIDCEQFVGVKGFKAKGKRITTYAVEKIEELEPTRFPEEQDNGDDDASGGSDGTANDSAENLDPDAGKSQRQVIDEITGQLELFPDDE